MHAFLIIRTGVGLWLEHNAFLHAGALAFFTLFSLAPTLIIRQPWPGIAADGDAGLFRDLPATPGPSHGRRR